MLLARIMSIETLLDMIWTNELAKQDHPEEEAINLVAQVDRAPRGGAPGGRRPPHLVVTPVARAQRRQPPLLLA